MFKEYKNHILVVTVIFVIEFSIILSWSWMTGNFDMIRFGVWPTSEWLINYQAGFVRRGLIGELIFQYGAGKPLITILNYLTFYLYLIYCGLFLLIYFLGRVRSLILLIVALLIPGGIFHMSISALFFTRKEILFLIFFAILCITSIYIRHIEISKRKFWIFLFSLIAIVGGIFLTLSHEAYLLMSFPYVATLFWVLKNENSHSKIIKIAFSLFLIVVPVTFAICVFTHGDLSISEGIWDSLTLSDRLIISPHSPYTVYGAIGGIGWTKLQNLSTLYGVFVTDGWIYWLFFGVANGVVLTYISLRLGISRSKQDQYEFVTILFIPIVCSMLMLFIGSDWGRWIASACNHGILLGFTLKSSKYAYFNKPIICQPQPKKWLFTLKLASTRWTSLTIIFYELIFQMPECCIEYPFIFIRYDHFIRAVILSNH